MTEQWPLWVVVERQEDDSWSPVKETLSKLGYDAWEKYEKLSITLATEENTQILPCRIEVKP